MWVRVVAQPNSEYLMQFARRFFAALFPTKVLPAVPSRPVKELMLVELRHVSGGADSYSLPKGGV